jgi:tetratricopeptide (TPR) repeat protein
MGQPFNLDALRHLIGDPRYDCAGLIERQLVRRDGQDYMFAHAMVREGVYSSLLDVKKREIHQRAAEWFENIDYMLRAEHLDRAENPGAVDAYRHAAENESKQFRFERALQLIGRGREIATDDGDVFRLLMLEGVCQSDIGNPAEAVEIYRQAQDVATDDVGRCHAWIGLASVMRPVDDYDRALATLDRAEPIARDNDMHRELSQVHYYRGSIYFPLGNLEGCLEQHGLALEYARRACSAEEETLALSGLGDANYMRGHMIKAFGYYDQCIELSHRNGFGRIEIANLVLRADTHLYQNRLKIAYDECMVAVSAAAKAGHHRAEIVARVGGLGWIGIETGELAATRHNLEVALDKARQIGMGRFQALALVFLAKIQALEDNWSGATASAEEAVSISREAGITFSGPMALGVLAVCRADPAARLDALREAEEILCDNCVSHNYFYLYRDGMEIHLHSGEWGRVEYFAQALEDYTSGEPLPWTDFFIARARVLAAYGKGTANDAATAELTRLRDEAVAVGFNTAMPALERALAGEPIGPALLPILQSAD